MAQKTENKTAQRTCPECEGAMVMRNYKHTEDVGKWRVTDGTGRVWQCSKCGEPELSLRMLAGYQRRAAAIVLREANPIDGSVTRYARKALGLRQTDLAGLLGYAPETLSRWETGDAEMPRTAQLALIAILDGVELCGGDVDTFVERERSDRRSAREFEVPEQRRTA